MKNRKQKVGFLLLPLFFSAAGCIAQKTLGVTFTESGKGVGIYSGLVEKTATAAPATVSSTATTIGSAVTILEFTVKENGSKDGYPLQIKELRFTNIGTADVADLRFVLEGPGSNNTVSQPGGNPVTFKDFGDIIVPDGDTTGRTYQVKVHVRSNIQGSTEDNSTVILKTSPVTDFDVTETSSNFLQSVASFQQNPAIAVDVLASQLQGKGTFSFGTVAANAVFPGPPSIYATDVYGRVDKDYAVNITISARDIDCASPPPNGGAFSTPSGCTTTCMPTQGVATWTDLRYTVGAQLIKTYVTSGSLPDICTAAITLP